MPAEYVLGASEETHLDHLSDQQLWIVLPFRSGQPDNKRYHVDKCCKILNEE